MKIHLRVDFEGPYIAETGKHARDSRASRERAVNRRRRVVLEKSAARLRSRAAAAFSHGGGTQ